MKLYFDFRNSWPFAVRPDYLTNNLQQQLCRSVSSGTQPGKPDGKGAPGRDANAR
jgi:hypothetical protein